MNAMTIRELITYLKSLPKDTRFPIGLGNAFIVNNVVDQIVFRPRLNQTADEMSERVENLLGLEVQSETGARSVVNQDHCFAYFGLDAHTVLTPLNIVVMTLLRSVSPVTRQVTVGFNKDDPAAPKVTFPVPSIWWDTLTKKHQAALALEYLTNDVLKGFNYKEGSVAVSENNLIIADSFGRQQADGVLVSDAFGGELEPGYLAPKEKQTVPGG